jgi:FkbM family methyltransferase
MSRSRSISVDGVRIVPNKLSNGYIHYAPVWIWNGACEDGPMHALIHDRTKGDYEPQTVEYMCANCKGGDMVHAGAGIGEMLPLLSSALVPGAKIWAFEPFYPHYICCRETVRANNLENRIVLRNYGLGATEAEVSFRNKNDERTQKGGGSHVLYEAHDGGFNKQRDTKINIRRLDDCIPEDRNITVLHLDVERYEKYALEGAKKIIDHCRPIVLIETVSEDGMFWDEYVKKGLYDLSQCVNRGNWAYVPVGNL